MKQKQTQQHHATRPTGAATAAATCQVAGMTFDDGAGLKPGARHNHHGPIAGPSSANYLLPGGSSKVSLGSKDLIIRMLAEVFQVCHSDDGQVKWQQVSSSLVPISLYSRTTSRWLEYLLAASTAAAANNPANAMSPDSRDFLMLLQQFHQQTGPLIMKSAQFRYNQQHQQPMQDQNFIVFQVVGHDFIDGQCKRILNVKILQPNTRLGRASDYFVYWRERKEGVHNQHFLQQQFSSSFASSMGSFMQPPYNNNRHFMGSSPNHPNDCCGGSPGQDFCEQQTQVPPQSSLHNTWGLNFASQNHQRAMGPGLSSVLSPGSMIINHKRAQERKLLRDRMQLHQMQLQQLQLQHQQLHQQEKLKGATKRRLGSSKCSTCRQLVGAEIARQQRSTDRDADLTSSGAFCAIHGNSQINEATTMRTRSRSTTRQPGTLDSVKASKRARSFSTPASPEFKLDPECPVHRRRHRADTECDHQVDQEVHHPRCMNLIQIQQQHQQQQRMDSLELRRMQASVRPHKPVRGLFRKNIQSNATTTNEQNSPVLMRQNTAISNQALHSKRNTKTRYMGHMHNLGHTHFQSYHNYQQQGGFNLGGSGEQRGADDQNFAPINMETVNFQANQSNSEDVNFILQQQQQQQQQALKFDKRLWAGDRSLQNRSIGASGSVGGPSFDADTFESSVHRDARLARERYANSRNMKEFLSLDAGGVFQASSVQQMLLDEKLQRAHGTSIAGGSGGGGGKRANNILKKQGSLFAKQESSTRRTHANFLDQSKQSSVKSLLSPAAQRQTPALSPERQQLTTGALDHETSGGKMTTTNLVANEPKASTEVTCNVSTTTDDLPLDPVTRKRMSKLTSEEVISERTEPKSMSTASLATNAAASNQAQSMEGGAREEKFDRQVRAVSLGRSDGGPASRGRGARSDTGRRRSLERSMCVDLDHSVTLSSFKKTKRLSPLPQAVSPLLQDSVKGSPICSIGPAGSSTIPAAASNGDGLFDVENRPLENPADKSASAYSEKSPDFLPGSRGFGGRKIPDHRYLDEAACKHNLALSAGQNSSTHSPNGRYQGEQDDEDYNNNFDTCQHKLHRKMTSFKSAPDISRMVRQHMGAGFYSTGDGTLGAPVGYDSHSGESQHFLSHHQQRHERRRQSQHHTQQKQQQQQQQTRLLSADAPSQQGMPLRTATMSSYAVPLCTHERDDFEHQNGRQYHSCPNSLRRKRRPVPGSSTSGINQFEQDIYGFPLSDYPANKCSCIHCQAVSGCKQAATMAGGTTHPVGIPCSKLSKEMQPDSWVLCQCNCCATASGRMVSAPDGYAAMHSSQSHEQQQYSSHLHHHYRHQLPNHHSHHQQHHHQQFPCAQCHCMQSYGSNQKARKKAKLPDETAASFDTRLPTAGSLSGRVSDCMAHTSSYRPRSSQSTRSPLHYGLYESECEDGDENDEEDGREDDDVGENIAYHHHQIHQHADCRASSSCCQHDPLASRFSRQSVILKPVQGYDQTMARTSLKSRQRSRSQPPIGEGYAIHLTKSMENVEKLIKEVQNELSDLRRRPPLGAASIDLMREAAGQHSVPTADASYPKPERTNNTPIENREEQKKEIAAMYIDLGLQSKLQPYVRFDWRLVAERGLRCYGHFHSEQCETKTVASCEIEFLSKMAAEESAAAEGVHHRDHQNRHQQQAASMADNQTRMSLSSATRRAGQFKCVGAIRKAGFLSVKKWILKRRQSVELARKQGWKRYWVCLRGTALLFHSVIDDEDLATRERNRAQSDERRETDLLSWIQTNCSSQLEMIHASLFNNETIKEGRPDPMSQEDFLDSMSRCFIERTPRHLIIIDGAIAQPIPEHPRRDFVFCLSTTFGDAYLFQASCQLESDNWISAVHNACAASIARDLTRDEAIKLFESKIRHFELEAEKKLFLRQRLESRLTSMSSMSKLTATDLEEMAASAASASQKQHHQENAKSARVLGDSSNQEDARLTMRSLLFRLSQQLHALDTYIEQVYCDVYQLRCYLSSCGAAQIFYRAREALPPTTSSNSTATNTNALASDLPHPKSLLMHVSKQTKLLLIKLGVFTVSSFHAYIHARQESAEQILRNIQQATTSVSNTGSLVSGSKQSSSSTSSKPMELRIRSQSIAETLRDKWNNARLSDETEQLISLANLAKIRVHVDRKLYNKIRHHQQQQQASETIEPAATVPATTMTTSDDRFSVDTSGSEQVVVISLKLNSSSSCQCVMKQVLKVIDPQCGELDFLAYYFQLVPTTDCQSNSGCESVASKRRDTLADWLSHDHLDLREKVVFRVELSRQRLEESTASIPFGISFEGQLFAGCQENLLNAYCSYVEWGSVADKAGLRDEDELLALNGILIGDLDMMFVECIVQEANKLRCVVRSSRDECPPGASQLDPSTLEPGGRGDDDEDDDDDDDNQRDIRDQRRNDSFRQANFAGGERSRYFVGESSQIISDEYVTSLVCPPPPSQSSAFLRTDLNLVRRKSDLCTGNNSGDTPRAYEEISPEPKDLLLTLCSASGGSNNQSFGHSLPLHKSKSQHLLDANPLLPSGGGTTPAAAAQTAGGQQWPATTSEELAKQLLKRTERLTNLLGKSQAQTLVVELNKKLSDNVCPISPQSSGDCQQVASATRAAANSINADQNIVERLKKSVLELLETEYAYVRHLETISEHYMSPLGELSFLQMHDLRMLSGSLECLLKFQRYFFGQLTGAIWRNYNLLPNNNETQQPQEQQQQQPQQHNDNERLEQIVGKLDASSALSELKPSLEALAEVFLAEADKFKDYANYCVAYSKLQKILHPMGFTGACKLPASSITSAPSSLNTFTSSLSSHLSGFAGSLSAVQQRGDFVLIRPNQLNYPMGPQQSKQSTAAAAPPGDGGGAETCSLKQLTEFLSNLDSSSSSASLSLPKSSSRSSGQASTKQRVDDSCASTGGIVKSLSGANKQTSTPAAASFTTAGSFHKSVHQQNFESYLIKPIQRIVKYPMLLNSIALAAQLLAEEPFYGALQSAIRQMESVISHVNDSQRVHDEYGLVFDLIGRQYLSQRTDGSKTAALPASCLFPGLNFGPNAHRQPPIDLSIGQLLHFGPVKWLNLHEFVPKQIQKKAATLALSEILFVFRSCVVFICKEQIGKSAAKSNRSRQQQQQQQRHSATGALLNQPTSGPSATSNPPHTNSGQVNEVIRFQTLIPVSEVQVRSVPLDQTANNTASFQWELFQCSSSNSNSSLLTKQSAASNSINRQNNNNTTTISGGTTNSTNIQSCSSNSNKNGKVYLLASPTNEERGVFLRKIRFIIRESVRNMSLPLARSPSSKSFSSNKKVLASSNSPTSSLNNTHSPQSSQSTSLSQDSQNSRGDLGGPNCNPNRTSGTNCSFASGTSETGVGVGIGRGHNQIDRSAKVYENSIEVNN